jgi:hypothetical protein
VYWSRGSSPLELIFFLLSSACWAFGGWLLVTHAFSLRNQERLISGLAAGMLLFMGLANLFAQLVDLTLAFWAASLFILLLGILSALLSKQKPWLDLQDLRAWPQLLALLLLTVLFVYIQRGLSLFDEYLHIPLTSTMGAGDIPPHFYLNPDVYFAYHYGIHLLAANLLRLGTLFPWSALDLSKAVMIAFTFSLSWLWIKRVTRSSTAGYLGSFLVVFGSGARWLLLPKPLLAWLSGAIQLVNTGADTAANFFSALYSPWVIEGGGSVLFPFAFHNGIFIPVMFQLGSTGAMPYMTVIVLLLLAPRREFTRIGLWVWSLLFATLALSAEHLFALLWIGIFLAALFFLITRWRRHLPIPRRKTYQWGAVLASSAVLAVIQGGFITESVRSLLLSLLDRQVNSFNTYGFAIRWPPALLSGHLGSLSLLDIRQLIVLLAELGPVILLIPIVLMVICRKRSRTNWLWLGLGLSAVLSILFPLFFQYGVDRSITRMPLTGMWTFLLMGFPLIWYWLKGAKNSMKLLAAVAYGLTVMSGIVIFIVQLQAIPQPQFTYFIESVDTHISRKYWNQLPADAQIFDSIPQRAVTVFGRGARAYETIYSPMTEWEELVADPHPVKLADSGFDYAYFERSYWMSLTSEQKETFQLPCIDIMEEEHQIDGDYRVLMDLRACAQ